MMHYPLLSILIWLPMLMAIPIGGFASKMRASESRYLALIVAIICFVISVLMYIKFDANTAAMQFVENVAWIPTLNINYHLGVDGLSLPLIVLTSFTTLVIVLASFTMVNDKVGQYLAVFLLMQAAVVGVFAALDAMLFYFFWEAMLIPMYLSIGIWGMANRAYAAMKFFIYTFFGSALMLAALVYLAMQANSFEILNFYQLKIPMSTQICVFVAFFLAFAIKIPMWPFHTWLPDAHTEAPTGGSVILAALMLKLGGYGFLRFSLPIVPDACRALDWLMIALSLFAIVYIGIVALSQADMKKLIAYSSVAHMGFVTLGCFLLYVIIGRTGSVADAHLGLEGAIVQMISHAFSSGALFLGFGMVYLQMHTRKIADFGGVASVMPVFAAFFILFAFSNVGLPGTSGFVGEFMVILSAFKSSFWATLLAALSLVIGAAYTLLMVKKVFYAPVVSSAVQGLKDIGGMERFIFCLLAIMVLALGVYPQLLLHMIQPTISHLLDLSLQSRLP